MARGRRTGAGAAGTSRQTQAHVKELRAMFSHVEEDCILMVLESCGGDMNVAAETLMAFGAPHEPAAAPGPGSSGPGGAGSGPSEPKAPVQEEGFWSEVMAASATQANAPGDAEASDAATAAAADARVTPPVPPLAAGDAGDVPHFPEAPEHLDPSSVERLLGRRPGHVGSSSYLCKWKGRSHVHCSWAPETILATDQRAGQRSARFAAEHGPAAGAVRPFVSLPEGSTDPEWILSARPMAGGGEEYLVKWRGLPASDSTWEAADVAGDANVAAHEKREASLPTRAEEWEGEVDWAPVPGAGAEIKADGYDGPYTLRPYQVESLKWNAFNWEQGRSCLLADEMGLGKTVQAASFLEHVKRSGCPRPSLVVVPLSTLGNWERELARWCSGEVVSYSGHSASRAVLREHALFFRSLAGGGGRAAKRAKGAGGGAAARGPPRFDVLLTTYETVQTDRAHLQSIPFEAMVVDEAHRLKKLGSKLAADLRSLRCRHRLLLSGTPLQNSTQELWSLLNFLDEAHFGDLDAFQERFGNMTTSADVAALHTQLRPYLLRRLKADVEGSLLPRVETLVECEMAPLQRMCYRALFERNFSYLEAGCTAGSFPAFKNLMMQLRKCCNHPFLLDGVEEAAEREGRGVRSADDLADPCGKLLFLGKLLEDMRAGGHRVLIFSQMTRVLDVLQDFCSFKGYPVERFDGSVAGTARQAAIDRFSDMSQDRFVFLLSTRAGGLGINLTAADRVVVYDSDWNPQNDAQALARCHRIGQTKEVKVFRLVTARSYEQRMLDAANRKLGLERAIFGVNGGGDEDSEEDGGSGDGDGAGGGAGGSSSAPSAARAEIDRLLREGAVSALSSGAEEDEDARAFHCASLEEVLARSSTKKVEAGEEGGGAAGPNLFATASFVAAGAEGGVDVEDPDFWQKVLPEAAAAEKQRAEEEARRAEAALADDDAERARRRSSQWPWPERRRAISALLQHGLCNWPAVRRAAKLPPSKSLDDIAAFCCHYALECVRHVRYAPPRPVDDAATELDRLAGAGYGESRDDCFTERQFVSHVSGRAEEDLARLDLLAPLVRAVHAAQAPLPPAAAPHADGGGGGENVEGGGGAPAAAPRPPNPEEGAELVAPAPPALPPSQAAQPPASWWGAQHDSDLLLGTYRHGYGRYSEIRADPALAFATACPAASSSADLEPPSAAAAAAAAGEGDGATPMDLAPDYSSAPAEEGAPASSSADGGGGKGAGGRGEGAGGPTSGWPSGRALALRLRRLLLALANPWVDDGGEGEKGGVAKKGIKRVRARSAEERPPPPPPMTKEEKAEWARRKMLQTLAEVERDAKGEVVMPLKVTGGITLECLGVLQPGRPGYQVDKTSRGPSYLLPLGYKAVRQFQRMDNPDERCDYTMEIVEGEGGPAYSITPAEGGAPVLQKSATGAWKEVLNKVAEAKRAKGEEPKKTAISGPDHFGFATPLVRALIEGLPGARSFVGYTGVTI